MLKRIRSIDFLRGLTVFSMIIYHLFIYWVHNKAQNYGPFAEIFHFFGYLAAPFFLIISGISYHIYIKRKIDEDQSKLKIFFEVLKRAIFIFTISTTFQLLFGFIFDMKIKFIIYWSVFQIISFSMVLFYSIQFCKKSLRILIHSILIVFFIIFEFIIKAYNIFFLYLLVEGTFEFIPWASFFLSGLIFGEIFLSFSNEIINNKMTFLLAIGICNTVFIIIWINIFDYYYYVPNFFPFFIMMIGIFCILSFISYYLLDIRKYKFYFQESLIRWGRIAFSVYYIHFGVIAIGNIFFPIFLNQIYTNGFLLYQFIIILILFFVALVIFTKIWQKYNYILGIEWIMNKFLKKTLFLQKTQEIKAQSPK
ncbi:MAG: heparan-alpha-glucosaminide N-acetyltransferase domain-containing protein [Candidatus Odinarchaeota archaeon]